METTAALTALDTLTATQYLDVLDNCARFRNAGPLELAHTDPDYVIRCCDLYRDIDAINAMIDQTNR